MHMISKSLEAIEHTKSNGRDISKCKLISITAQIINIKTLFFFFLHFSHCALGKHKTVINPVKGEQTATAESGSKYTGDSTRERNKGGKTGKTARKGKDDTILDDIDIALAEIKKDEKNRHEVKDKPDITTKEVSVLTKKSKDEAQKIAQDIFNGNENIKKAKNEFVENINKYAKSNCKRINNSFIQNLTNEITAKYIEKIKIMYEIKQSKSSNIIFDKIKHDIKMKKFLEIDFTELIHRKEEKSGHSYHSKLYQQSKGIGNYKNYCQNLMSTVDYLEVDCRNKIIDNYKKRTEIDGYYRKLETHVGGNNMIHIDIIIQMFLGVLERYTNLEIVG